MNENELTARKVDVSHIKENNTKENLDNYMPCLCNGIIIEGLDKDWNPQNWNPEFHIENNNLVGLVAITVSYTIYKSKSVVANGKIVYNVSSGEIDNTKFICNIVDKGNTSINDIEMFLKNIIVLFGRINYIAKKNAMKKGTKSPTQKKNNKYMGIFWDIDDVDIEYQFQEKFEQPPHIPKEKKSRKNKKKIGKPSQPKKSVQKRRPTKIIYKVEIWERAGYYTRKGIYVPPCTIHRHHMS